MNLKLQLKILSFLQFCLWGSWLTTLGSYMFVTLKFDGASIGAVYSSLGIAAVFMPALLGIVADKWLSAKWVYAICHTIGAITLFMAAEVTTPEAMFLVILINSFAYMPTLGLINTISYYRLQNAGMDIVTDFPPIRIWGTIGFIMAMWVVSLSGFELSHMQLYIGAALSAVLVLFTLTLPHIPVAKQQANQSWTTLLGLDAFALFKNKRMAIFFIFSMLLGAELQITNMFGNTFLHSFDKDPMFASSFIVQHASIIMSISQISETLFILTIPFFLSRYGIKNVMMISIVAWILRFALFAYGDPTPFGTVLLVLSMIVYGCAFDFSERIRVSMTSIFGLASLGIGILLVVKCANLPAMVLATLLGALIGEICLLEKGVNTAVTKAQNLFRHSRKKPAHESFIQNYVAIIVLFCASGTGIFGAMNEGMTGDPSILIAKSFLDFFTAMIFACSLGIAVSVISIPLLIIQLTLAWAAALILPLTTPSMMADFSAVGGLLLLATGLRICGIKMFPVVNMLPALLLAMPLSAAWTAWFA